MSHASRPGRNSPCPCGSGRKFKHCHERSAGGSANAEPAAGKVSAKLLELAGTLLDDPDLDDEEFLTRLRMALMAWNIAELEASADDTSSLRVKLRAIGIESQIDELAQEKARLFPDDHRHLLDVVVTRNAGGGRYVQVISAS